MIDPDFRIYLSDFGLAVRIQGNSHQGRAGTSCYYPYEMVKNLRYDTRADLWCMGVLMVEMLFGTLPFKQSQKTKCYTESITNLRFALPENNSKRCVQVSTEARQLIHNLLVPQETRLTLDQIERDPWVLKTFTNAEKL